LVDAAVGDRVTVAIRPERIRIDPSPPTDARWRPARVIDCSYHGDTQRFQVELEGRDILSVFRPNAGQPLIPLGASAAVSWGPGDAWVIPESTEPPMAV
jgi:putative spermidine/putrescine transport system ATP-binding protein